VTEALLIMYGPIALFGYTLLILDWLARRKERRERERHSR
jgi:membrane protein required for beta-lactamase induction